MTISLTVIMLEATGDVQYVLPLMVTLIAARWAGNAFNEGLYDIHIHLNGLPILEPACPQIAVINDMCVREIMSDKVVKLHSIMKVGELYDMIADTTHNLFPVERLADGQFQGTMSRNRIAILFRDQAFGAAVSEDALRVARATPRRASLASIYEGGEGYYAYPSPIDEGTGAGSSSGARPVSRAGSADGRGGGADGAGAASRASDASAAENGGDLFDNAESNLLSPLVAWEKLEGCYPRYPDIKSVVPAAADRDKLVDLRPYINTSPYTVHESASVRRAYTFFRSMAMRHLCIQDHEHRCVGIVTRHDLLEHHIEDKLHASNAPLFAPAFAGTQIAQVGAHTPFRRRLISRKNSSGTSLYKFGGFPAGKSPAASAEQEDE